MKHGPKSHSRCPYKKKRRKVNSLDRRDREETMEAEAEPGAVLSRPRGHRRWRDKAVLEPGSGHAPDALVMTHLPPQSYISVA